MEWEFVLSAARSIGGAFSLDGSRLGGRFAAPTLTGESQIGWVTKDFRSRLSNAFLSAYTCTRQGTAARPKTAEAIAPTSPRKAPYAPAVTPTRGTVLQSSPPAVSRRFRSNFNKPHNSVIGFSCGLSRCDSRR